MEAAATILYKFGKNITNISEGECVCAIQSFKQYIPSDIIIKAYGSIRNFKLDTIDHSITSQQVDDLKMRSMKSLKSWTHILIIMKVQTIRSLFREPSII